MIVNGINKIVTGMTGGNPREPHRRHWKQCREACCQSKTETNINAHDFLSDGYVTLSYPITCVSGSTSNQVSTKKAVSKCQKIIRLLRCDPSVLREEDGAVEFRILAPMSRSEFTSSQRWSIRTWLNYLQKGGGSKKRFQCCVDPHAADTILYLRAIRGHIAVKHINPTLQDNVLLPGGFAEHIYHVGSSHDLHSIIQSGLIPGGKDVIANARHARP